MKSTTWLTRKQQAQTLARMALLRTHAPATYRRMRGIANRQGIAAARFSIDSEWGKLPAHIRARPTARRRGR